MQEVSIRPRAHVPRTAPLSWGFRMPLCDFLEGLIRVINDAAEWTEVNTLDALFPRRPELTGHFWLR